MIRRAANGQVRIHAVSGLLSVSGQAVDPVVIQQTHDVGFRKSVTKKHFRSCFDAREQCISESQSFEAALAAVIG